MHVGYFLWPSLFCLCVETSFVVVVFTSLLALFFCCCLWASAITPALHLAALLHLLPLPLTTLLHLTAWATSACLLWPLSHTLSLPLPACLPWLFSCTKSPLFLCLRPLPAISLFCCYWVTSLAVVAAAVPYCFCCSCVGCCFWLLFFVVVVGFAFNVDAAAAAAIGFDCDSCAMATCMLTLASALTFPGAADTHKHTQTQTHTERHTRIYINQCAAFINARLATLAAYHARIVGVAGGGRFFLFRLGRRCFLLFLDNNNNWYAAAAAIARCSAMNRMQGSAAAATTFPLSIKSKTKFTKEIRKQKRKETQRKIALLLLRCSWAGT